MPEDKREPTEYLIASAGKTRCGRYFFFFLTFETESHRWPQDIPQLGLQAYTTTPGKDIPLLE
jgi:hypothetical protein